MTFRVLKPIALASAQLVSSSVPETDHPAWNAATNYTVGTLVIRTTTHRIYENMIAGINAALPEDSTGGTTPRWLDIGPTNRWAMFDNMTTTTTTGTSPVTVVMQPGVINALAVVGAAGVASVNAVLMDGATEVYNQTKTLDGTVITDWYAYFFEPYDTADTVFFEGIPAYLTGTLTVTFTAAGAATPAVGALIMGTLYEMGRAEYGATAGIVDYSVKSTDDFGNTTLLQRSFSKRMSVNLFVLTAEMRRVHTLLAGLRSTPCVWIGTDDTTTYAPLVVYGFYKDFSIDIAYATFVYCNLEIEGMI